MSNDDRADAIIPTAAALVCAVADRDRDGVAEILNSPDLDWQALAVVLAASVSPHSAIARDAKIQLSDDQIVEAVIAGASRAFATTPEAIVGTDRRRNVTDARAVAMAACRLAGLTSVFIGDRFNKDHSTVLYAASRVGEHDRLQRIAKRLAAPFVSRRGLLGDAREKETAA